MTQADLSEQLVNGLAIREHLSFRISRLQARLNADALKLLDNVSGLTVTQWRLLVLLYACGEGRATDLARLSTMDKGLMSRTIKQMVKSGLLTTETVPDDNRAQTIRLSELGRETYEATLPHMQSRRDMLRSSLTDLEMQTFNKVLDKLEDAMIGDAL